VTIPAINVHHTGTIDEPWDRNAAVSAMPNDDEVLHYCFAWESQDAADAPSKKGDDDADDQKGNYAFPHHKTKGGPANIPACRNGLARLENSDIPAGDKAGVKAHLQAHLDDFNKKDGGDDDKSNLAGFQLVDAAAWARAGHLGNLVSEDRVRERAVRAHTAADNSECWRITNADGDVATLDLYGDIGFWGGVTANDFNQQLKNITAQTLTIHVNSPGGDVFDGIAILNMLRAHPADKHVVVDGLAASAASFISMAGNTVTMMPNSMMMIHDASGGCLGNAAEMQQMADLLDKVSDNLASIYATKSGKGTAAEWRDVMRAEQWYTADEAVEAGLADRVGDTDSPSEFKPPTDRWTLNFYNYAGRSAAPPPKPIVAVVQQQEPAGPAPVLTVPAPSPVPTVTNSATTTTGGEPAPTPAAAPAAEPALADRRVEDTTPTWNPDLFRQAMKERAAQ
jgi:ATP-dependent Clp endopeptidase proteolytic subunit ClpP